MLGVVVLASPATIGKNENHIAIATEIKDTALPLSPLRKIGG
jgi:hypothetical protein